MQEVGREQAPPLAIRDEHGGVSAERKEHGWTIEGARCNLYAERKADAGHKSPDNSGASMHELAAELFAALHRRDDLGTPCSKREGSAHGIAETLRRACIKRDPREAEGAPLGADDQ